MASNWLSFTTFVSLIHCFSTGEIIRGADGLALTTENGEAGQFVCKPMKDADPTAQFDGYLDKEASGKKLGYNILPKVTRHFYQEIYWQEMNMDIIIFKIGWATLSGNFLFLWVMSLV